MSTVERSSSHAGVLQRHVGFANELGAMAVLVGREQELAQAAASLATPGPVLSICGVAGSGKTALAVEAARRAAVARKVGYSLVDLSAALDHGDVIAAVRRSLGIDEGDAGPLMDALQGQGGVLILDDADGVLDALEAILPAILECPGVSVVVTRTRPFDGGEAISLTGLGLAEVDAPAEEALGSPAVSLFAAVARSVEPSFALDAANIEAVAGVCRAVDGLPLAIILAAARVRLLGMRGLVNALVSTGSLFDVLSAPRSGSGSSSSRPSGPGPSEVRHRTMRGALEWSTQLLDPNESAALRRLSVFRGAFGLDAAEHVCAIARGDLYDAVTTLVDTRLIELASPDAQELPRFRLTGIIRGFAAEKLVLSGEQPEVLERHARWFASLAREANELIWDARETSGWALLVSSADDLQGALSHMMARRDHADALRLAADLTPLAYQLGRPEPVIRSIQELLPEDPDAVEPGLRADALLSLSCLGIYQVTAPEMLAASQRHWDDGVELARSAGEPRRVLRALGDAVLALPVTRDFARASAAAAEGRALARELGHAAWLARFNAWSGMASHLLGDHERAARFAVEAYEAALRAGDRRALILVGLLVHPMAPEHAPTLESLPDLPEMLEMAVALGDVDLQAFVLDQLAGRAILAGDDRAAVAVITRRLRLVRRSSAWYSAGFSVMQMALILAARQDHRLAARTHGSLIALLPILRSAVPLSAVARYDATIANVRAALGDALFEDETRRGSLMSLPQIAREILPRLNGPDESPPTDPSGSPPGPSTGLTAREVEVLALLADGLSNKEIASVLAVSPKTVMHHAAAIYRKLGVRGRSEAVVAAVKRGLVQL